jgi:hypothetical protein
MERYPIMPCLAQGFHGFHHTLDSALAILFQLDVPATRVTVNMAGRGYPTRWIVEQDPPAGTELHPSLAVRLSVAGTGFFHALPIGMWDTGGESEPGTREIVGLLDDPLQKAGHWLREGARLFDIAPDNPAACSRWIGLFGLNAADWPASLWYNLALLLPSLSRLAGREEGIRFALQFLLGLGLKEIRRAPAFEYLDQDQRSLLGSRLSRLGVDSILGDRVEQVARLTFVLGPVELDTYYDFCDPARRDLLEAALDLVCSCYQPRSVCWLVRDPAQPPVLGDERRNGRLGINSYLGATHPLLQTEPANAM